MPGLKSPPDATCRRRERADVAESQSYSAKNTSRAHNGSDTRRSASRCRTSVDPRDDQTPMVDGILNAGIEHCTSRFLVERANRRTMHSPMQGESRVSSGGICALAANRLLATSWARVAGRCASTMGILRAHRSTLCTRVNGITLRRRWCCVCKTHRTRTQ